MGDPTKNQRSDDQKDPKTTSFPIKKRFSIFRKH